MLATAVAVPAIVCVASRAGVVGANVDGSSSVRWVARIDLVPLLGDVTTTWPQNSLVALDCEARIVRARSGFQRILIAISLTPATHCHAVPVGGR